MRFRSAPNNLSISALRTTLTTLPARRTAAQLQALHVVCRESTLMQLLPISQQMALCEIMTLETHDSQGDVEIYRKGDEGKVMYIVIVGTIKLWIKDKSGLEVVTAIKTAGSSFGELNSTGEYIPFAIATKRLTNATTTGPCALICIDMNAYNDSIKQTVLKDAIARMEKAPSERDAFDLEQLHQMIKGVKFFEALGKDVLTELCRILGCKFYSGGSTVFRQGTRGKTFYIILSGSVDVYIDDAEGNHKKVAEKHAGDSFGELSLVQDAPRTATIVCKEDSYFITVEKPHYVRALKAVHMQMLSAKIAWLQKIFPAFRKWVRRDLLPLTAFFVTQSRDVGDVVAVRGQELSGIGFIVTGECRLSIEVDFTRVFASTDDDLKTETALMPALGASSLASLASSSTVVLPGQDPRKKRSKKVIDLCTIGPGDCFGEVEMFAGWKTYCCQVTTTQATQIAMIPASQLVERIPAAALSDLRRNAMIKGQHRLMQVEAIVDTMTGWRPTPASVAMPEIPTAAEASNLSRQQSALLAGQQQQQLLDEKQKKKKAAASIRLEKKIPAWMNGSQQHADLSFSQDDVLTAVAMKRAELYPMGVDADVKATATPDNEEPQDQILPTKEEEKNVKKLEIAGDVPELQMWDLRGQQAVVSSTSYTISRSSFYPSTPLSARMRPRTTASQNVLSSVVPTPPKTAPAAAARLMPKRKVEEPKKENEEADNKDIPDELVNSQVNNNQSVVRPKTVQIVSAKYFGNSAAAFRSPRTKNLHLLNEEVWQQHRLYPEGSLRSHSARALSARQHVSIDPTSLQNWISFAFHDQRRKNFK